MGHLTAKLVHGMSFADVAERLQADGVEGDEAFWAAVKENCSTVSDAKKWWELVVGSVTPDIAEEDKEFIAQAKELLPQEPWSEATWVSGPRP